MISTEGLLSVDRGAFWCILYLVDCVTETIKMALLSHNSEGM